MRACLLAWFMAGAALGACADDDGDDGDDAGASTLYDRLGGAPGIGDVIEDFVARVENDAKINGYFLNATVDRDRLIDCLIRQVGNATGGPQVYPDPANGCRAMDEAHAGLGISSQDFDDLVGHLVDALDAAQVSTDEVTEITAVLAPLEPDIVEDVDNDLTVYQRVGRKPAIAAVIDLFLGNVLADARINGFFADPRVMHLRTCLIRQVCSIDGPCRYGREVEHPADPGVTTFDHCAGMVQAHTGVLDTDANPIVIEDFNALVEDLVAALDTGGVTTADKNAILGVLGPLCSSIVSVPGNCP